MLHTFLELDITACFFFDVGQTKYYKFSFFLLSYRYARKFSPLFLSATKSNQMCRERSKKSIYYLYNIYIWHLKALDLSHRNPYISKNPIFCPDIWYSIKKREAVESLIATTRQKDSAVEREKPFSLDFFFYLPFLHGSRDTA